MIKEEKFSLPMSQTRRSEIEILEPEDKIKDNFRKEVALKALDSLPSIIELAKSIVEIKRKEMEAEKVIELLKEKGNLLIKEADAFVKKEIAMRDSFIEKAGSVQSLLRDLYIHLNQSTLSDDIQKEVINSVNKAIESLFSPGAKE